MARTKNASYVESPNRGEEVKDTNEEEKRREEEVGSREEEKVDSREEEAGEKEDEAGEEEEEIAGEKTGEEEEVAGEKTGEEEEVAGEKPGEEEEVTGEKTGEEEEVAGEKGGEEKEVGGEKTGEEEKEEAREKTGEEEEEAGERTGEEEEEVGGEEGVAGEKTGEEEEEAGGGEEVAGEKVGEEEEEEAGEGGLRNREEEEMNEDSDDGTQVMRPLKMYFEPTRYNRTCKIASRCYIHKAVETINNLKRLSESEINWFENHPQFKHMFHMERDRNHRVMGMWMLMLRTAVTDKKNEHWFIVNGVPIRYSLREHALISGLYCHEYPAGYERLGSMRFVEKYFPKGSKITIALVEKKLKDMKRCDDRLRMAVLYFLASVIIGKSKGGKDGASIHPFFLRAVDDLQLCETFPWGRLSFEDNIKEIKHMLHHFDGVAKGTWTFPSFIMPLELLVFEAIPDLMGKFREDVRRVDSNCPRMCKTKYRSSAMKGFPLEEINEVIGTTKDVRSILVPSTGERHLLSNLLDELDDGRDEIDPIVDGWHTRLLVEKKKIWFEEMFNSDVAARMSEVAPSVVAPTPLLMAPESTSTAASHGLDKILQSLKKFVEDRFEKVDEKIVEMSGRVKTVEDGLKELKKFVRNELNPTWYDETEIGDGCFDISGRNDQDANEVVGGDRVDKVGEVGEKEKIGDEEVQVEKVGEEQVQPAGEEQEEPAGEEQGKEVDVEEKEEEDENAIEEQVQPGGEEKEKEVAAEEEQEKVAEKSRKNKGKGVSVSSQARTYVRTEGGKRLKILPTDAKKREVEKKKKEVAQKKKDDKKKKKEVDEKKKDGKKKKDDEDSDNDKKRRRSPRSSRFQMSPYEVDNKKKKKT